MSALELQQSLVKSCLLLVTFFFSACATTNSLDNLAEMLQGRYDSHPQGTAASADSQRFVDSHQRADAPALGDYVFYLQLNRGQSLTLYRQRLLVFALNSHNGQIEQRSYALNAPERFVDANRGDPILSGLTSTDIQSLFDEGCEQLWEEIDDGFRGYVDPSTCRIWSKRTQRYRRIEGETVLGASSLGLVERGYDDNLVQEFGTKQGEILILTRIE